MAESICDAFAVTARRLLELGLGYLTLDRAASTLSTGERQRMQLARAVRNRTTGVLYVLDEPSIGLHPSNLEGLCGVMRDLVADGNSVLLVDHDTQVLREADWLIELGAGGRRARRTGDRAGDCRGRLRGPAVADRAVSGRPRAGLCRRRGRRAVRPGPNPPVRVRAPYGQAAHGGNPERAGSRS